MLPALKERAEKAAEAQGVAVNQPINMAVAQMVSTLDAAEYFRERGRRRTGRRHGGCWLGPESANSRWFVAGKNARRLRESRTRRSV
jgi:hypothetical protein